MRSARVRRVALALLLLLAACKDPGDEATPVGDGAAWYVEVEGPGGYWLDPDDLRTMGIGADATAAPTVRLSWSGRSIPYLPRESDDGWGIFFFAPDRSPRTSRRTAIRLDREMPGPVMQATDPSDGHEPCDPARIRVRREKDQRYLPQAEAEVPWFWEPLRTPGSVTHTVVLTEAVSGAVTVTLDLWSHTSSPVDPDHRLVLEWDGRAVGDWFWDGRGMQHLSVSFSLSAGAGEEHGLTLRTPAVPGAEVGLVWLDRWAVSYRRPVAANGGVWKAEGTAMRVGEAGAGAWVVDVSDPFAPLDLGPVASGACVGASPDHRYWVGVPDEAPGAAAVRPAKDVDVDALTGAVYLAVAPPAFHDALRPLLEHRQGQGLTTGLVDPQAVYDTMGTGQSEPEAIRALVRQLPELRYLLLVGDGTAEPAGSDGEAGELRVVVPFTRTTGLGETPADGLLGIDGEENLAIAVGRFPAASSEQVRAMVEKTIEWESEEDAPQTLVLSDDEAEFGRMAEEIAELLPSGAVPKRMDAGEEDSRRELLAALGQDRTWLNYTGHGSLTLLCDEGLLTLEDGETWGSPALVTAWSCLAAHYAHPTQDSMAEVWMRTPRGGAVAFLGPVGETTSAQQRPFARAFYEALQTGARLGDAWLVALERGGAEDVRWGYALLGDPALRLGLE